MFSTSGREWLLIKQNYWRKSKKSKKNTKINLHAKKAVNTTMAKWRGPIWSSSQPADIPKKSSRNKSSKGNNSNEFPSWSHSLKINLAKYFARMTMAWKLSTTNSQQKNAPKTTLTTRMRPSKVISPRDVPWINAPEAFATMPSSFYLFAMETNSTPSVESAWSFPWLSW
jgi:hypothetical protein